MQGTAVLPTQVSIHVQIEQENLCLLHETMLSLSFGLHMHTAYSRILECS